MPDQTHHLLLRDDIRNVQLLVRNVPPSGFLRMMIEIDQNPALLKARLASLESYNRLGTNAPLATRQFPALQHRNRLRQVVRALDGRKAGASHRDIAIALYGRERVASDWRDPGAHLQDAVRRLIGRGRNLVNGGYLTFLS